MAGLGFLFAGVATVALPDAAHASLAMRSGASRGAGPTTDSSFTRLRGCESAGNYRANTGNGYYGACQMAMGTWRSLG